MKGYLLYFFVQYLYVFGGNVFFVINILVYFGGFFNLCNLGVVDIRFSW